jgi:Putative zinc ribbon domain
MEHYQHLSFCQSCAMPMAKPDDYGTNLDGSQSKEYCHYSNSRFEQKHMWKTVKCFNIS